MDEFDAQEVARQFALDWIKKQHADGQDVLSDHKTPEAALRWYCSYKEAQMNFESNRIKDWAHMFLEGINPMNDAGEADTFHVWVNDEEDGLWEDWEKDLTQDLKEFYGIEEED